MYLTFTVAGLITAIAFAQIEVETATTNLVDKIDPSDKALTCMVNLDGHAINYDPIRWALSPFITDLSILVDTTANPEGVVVFRASGDCSPTPR